jgi:hypothetical protein
VNSSTVEKILTKLHNTWLSIMERQGYERVKLIVYSSVKDVHSKVYGVDAGEESIVPAGVIDALVSGNVFAPSDNYQASTLEEGWLFSTSQLILPGVLVEIEREDFRNRKYKVVSLERIGNTLSVFKKFKLSSTS